MAFIGHALEDATLRRLCRVDPVPVPDDFPVLYAWAEPEDAWRLAGRTRETPRADYGLPGTGWRLASLGAGSDNPLHTNGYTYASTDPRVRASQVIHAAKDECLPVEIRLRWLNEVYVVDNAAFRRDIKEKHSMAAAEGRDKLTERELNESILATARTIVPWSDYLGDFEEPVVLIGRQTERDEVRLMRGPVRVAIDKGNVTATMADDETGLNMILARARGSGVGAARHAMRVAENASLVLGVPVEATPDVLEKLSQSEEDLAPAVGF